MRRCAFMAAFLVSALPAQSPVVDPQFIKDWVMSKSFTLAVAEAMPADKYAFKVEQEEMTFALLMVHIATSQAFRFAQIAGKRVPFAIPNPIPKDSAKEVAMQLLNQSFDFCIGLLPQFTAAQMEKSYEVGWFERPAVTGRELVLGMFTHTAHHRGQAEVYLRANGIKPPPYRF